MDSQLFFFFSIVIYNLIMTIKLHQWKQLRTYKLFFEPFLVFRNYITWSKCLLALIPGKFILNLKGRQGTYFSVKISSHNKFAIFCDCDYSSTYHTGGRIPKWVFCVCIKHSNLILLTECTFCSYTCQLFFWSSAFTSLSYPYLYALSDSSIKKQY